eukprot:CAMPEP_0171491798 /NCGR_PEP_ID=MMETSP0958-20121227/4054_1 /TAXON_ID=87120 /ORGANISM="Aurantiochytrium limacinum, Strain ATCCMYA-1381" /LENGTH=31 /DNA_ID= /DNA_START= /DNA_END= /DNA_ORIENTATION=
MAENQATHRLEALAKVGGVQGLEQLQEVVRK